MEHLSFIAMFITMVCASTLFLVPAQAASPMDNALVKQHGIKAERLKAEGVASFAPVSNNTAEAGRAKNRRVEMVLR